MVHYIVATIFYIILYNITLYIDYSILYAILINVVKIL